MELTNRSVALYGRFSAGQRERLQAEIIAKGGTVARDITRRSDLLVIGALAASLIDCGALTTRLSAAKSRNVPVMGERSFTSELAGAAPSQSTLPLDAAVGDLALTRDEVEVLVALDLIALRDEKVRFADARTLRTAADFRSQGRSLAETVKILQEAESAPVGRHKLVLMPSGSAALQWEQGLSNLQGQGLLPLDPGPGGIDELFEAAQLKEAAGEGDDAAKLYDMCARAERSDGIALYNLGNIRLAQRAHREAALAYQRALARDPKFVEARYNLALALEASGKPDEAIAELIRALEIDPSYSDAVFNCAQLLMKGGKIAAAKDLYERYLSLNPPSEWAATARKAIAYCSARLSA